MTRYSVYDVSGGLVSIDQVGVGPTEYIRASGMVLARVAGAAVTWLHPDHLGSAVAGTGSTGSVVWRESEQPFWEDWITAPANDNQAGYKSKVNAWSSFERLQGIENPWICYTICCTIRNTQILIT